MEKLPIRIRKANEEDIPFIFNSWLKSYRNSKFAKSITSTIYFTEHHKIIQSIVTKNEVLIACNNEDPSQVYGYCCAGFTEGFFTLHYIYVKHSFRGLGIAKVLMSKFNHDTSTASIYTHHTRVADKLAPKYNMIYHPYIVLSSSISKGAVKAESSDVKVQVKE